MKHKCKIHPHYGGLKKPTSKARGCTCLAIYEENQRFVGAKCGWCRENFRSHIMITEETFQERHIFCCHACYDLYRTWRKGKKAIVPLRGE